MTPSQSSNVVRWAAETFHTAMFINYEQVNKQITLHHITPEADTGLLFCVWILDAYRAHLFCVLTLMKHALIIEYCSV